MKGDVRDQRGVRDELLAQRASSGPAGVAQTARKADSLGSLGCALCCRWTERFTSRGNKSAALLNSDFSLKQWLCILWLLFGSGGFVSGAEKG